MGWAPTKRTDLPAKYCSAASTMVDLVEPASEIITPSRKSKLANSLMKAIVCLIGKLRIMTSAKGAKLAKSSVARSIMPSFKAISLEA
ncbi:Uncharacterised protein [Streptococcus pneumoniae]|nr:Uncharacterised protein [Streptococcus pneumoniae]